MLKIIDGLGRGVNDPAFDRATASAFLGNASEQVQARLYDLGHGQVEVTGSRVIEWSEVDWSPAYLQDVIDAHHEAKAEEDPDEVEERNRQRAARRARTQVRRDCKTICADTLLTLTYRANETDLDRCKADLKEFVRRVRRVLPDFKAVACFETQKRGAWHVHLATAGIPTVLRPVKGGDFRSFNVLRSIWHSVVKDRGGNIDLSRRKRHCKKSIAEVAAYISKYIAKSFLEGMDKGRNRWTKFGDFESVKPVELPMCSGMLDSFNLAFSLVTDAHVVARFAMDRFKDWFYLAAELPKPKNGTRGVLSFA
jgi:hypothetical protein